MQSIPNVIRLAPLSLVLVVGASACASGGFEEDSRARTRSSSQGLTPDDECTRSAGSATPLFSGTHFGGGNGMVDLGNGATATVSNSDGVTFDWSATMPIDIVIVRGSSEWASVYSFEPEAAPMSGTRLSAPKNPDDQERQFPLTTIKFCYRAENSVPTPDGGQGSDAGGEEPGGGKSW